MYTTSYENTEPFPDDIPGTVAQRNDFFPGFSLFMTWQLVDVFMVTRLQQNAALQHKFSNLNE